MKKFLSLVLALVMTMSLVTISAGAADFTDDEAITYSEAVEVMTAIGVVSGYTDGSFKPGTALNRGQAAKIICNMILGPTTAAALATTDAPFKDVPADHVFAGYIAYCVTEGIISGYADGTFKPAAPLTGYAFWKMLLGALGYDADIEGYNQPNWAVQVAKRGLNIELDKGLKADFVGTKALTREEACLYAFNTLKADMVDYGNRTAITVGDINITTSADVKPVDEGKNIDGLEICDDDYLQFAEKYFADLEGEKAYDNFGRPATKWTWDGDKVGTYTKDAKYVITFDKWYDIDSEAEMVEEFQDLTGNKKLEKTNATKLTINGKKSVTADLADYAFPGTIIELYTSKNTVTDAVVLVPYAAEITDIDDELSKAENKKGATYEIELTYTMLDEEDEPAEVVETFYDDHDKKSENVLPGFDAETYVEETILVVIPNFATASSDPAYEADTVLASYVAETEKGILNSWGITDKESRTFLKLEGTKYPMAGTLFADEPALGKEQTVYMTEEGFVVDVIGASAQNIEDVYYVTGVYKTTSTKGTVSYFAETVALDGTQADLKLESGDDLIPDLDEGEVYAEVGGLYILTDEKQGDHKANNNKYDSVEFDYDIDGYDEEDETTAFNGYVVKVWGELAKDVKATDSKFEVDGEKVYLGDDTVLVGIEKAADDLKVTTAKGGMKMAAEYEGKVDGVKTDLPATVIALVDVDDLKVATNVLYITGDMDAAVASDEVLYIAYNGDWEFCEDETYIDYAWFMADLKASEITIDDTYERGVFAQFSIDEDEVYTLTVLSEDTDLDEDVEDDTDAYLYAASFTEENTYKNGLTITGLGFDFEDVDYSNAVINDDRADIDGAVYDSEINSVARLNKAIKAETEIVADIYVKGGEIVFINVIDAE